MVSRKSARKDPNPWAGYREIHPDEAGVSPSPASVLPAKSAPKVASFAPGPFIEGVLTTPSHIRWRNASTVIIRAADGSDWRCIRITSGDRGTPRFVGYWAVHEMGAALDLEA